ncbi:MAG: hypothetical protein KC420_09730 [Myxococcales bacterium]|nr:hypothetical protein [Myxococcales bacterium]MCB9706752.1 hypothetical protein [Myxococcales bacterium]
MRAEALRTLFTSTLLGVVMLAVPVACSGDDSSGSDSATSGDTAGSTAGSTGDLGEGVTDCTPPGLPQVVCQAGQYCADSVLADCQNGCLSNDNCAADQTCEKAAGEDVGSCQNMGGAGPTEAEFCEKLLVCDPAGTMEQCSMVYKGTNETCHQCIVDGNCGDINNGSCDAQCGI